MFYIEITCNDCNSDLGYGKPTPDNTIDECKYCKSTNVEETEYFDD